MPARMSWLQLKLPILIFCGIVVVIQGLREERPNIVLGGWLFIVAPLILLVVSVIKEKAKRTS